MWIGDVIEDDTIYFNFTTTSAGAPTTLAGTPVLSVYKDDGTTQSVAGITLSVDFDGVTGLNNVKIILTDAFYVTGADYSVVITTGTVDGNSVVGYVVGQFAIENRFPVGFVPSVAAGANGGLPTVNASNYVAGIVGSTHNTLDDLNTQLSNIDTGVDNLEADLIGTYAEVSSVPAANAKLMDKLGWLFALGRNKRTTNATTDTIRDDGDTGDIGASTISDAAGTFTRGKYT